MTASEWVSQTIWEDTSLKVMARMRDIDAALVTQASLTSISYRVVAGGVEIIAPTAITKSTSVFDTLQTSADDASWVKDSTGYNFKFVFPTASFPTGDTIYYVPITFTDSAGYVSVLPLQVTTKETYVDTPA